MPDCVVCNQKACLTVQIGTGAKAYILPQSCYNKLVESSNNENYSNQLKPNKYTKLSAYDGTQIMQIGTITIKYSVNKKL
jgi:hypothetical protein